MRYVVSVGFLGYTRCNNVCAYNPDSRGFDDLTPAEARRAIDNKQLKGVLWRNGEEGPEFYPDSAGFNQKDIMIKSANKFRPMLNDVLAGNPVNSFLTVVRVIDTDYRGRLYEIVSNKYSRIKITEQNLRELNEITLIAGAVITDSEIKICDDVQYEDRRAEAKFSKGIYKDGIVTNSLSSTAEQSEPTAEQSEPTSEQPEPTAEPTETLSSLFGEVAEQIAEQVESNESNEKTEPEVKTTSKSSKRQSKKK